MIGLKAWRVQNVPDGPNANLPASSSVSANCRSDHRQATASDEGNLPIPNSRFVDPRLCWHYGRSLKPSGLTSSCEDIRPGIFRPFWMVRKGDSHAEHSAMRVSQCNRPTGAGHRHAKGNHCRNTPPVLRTWTSREPETEDWSPDWGGGAVFYANQRSNRLNPEPADFESRQSTEFLNNRSLLFKNTEMAWHGVEELCCPPDRHRRIFNVIFERPVHHSVLSGSRTLVRRLMGSFLSAGRKH